MIKIYKENGVYTLMQERFGTRKYTWMSQEEFKQLHEGITEVIEMENQCKWTELPKYVDADGKRVTTDCGADFYLEKDEVIPEKCECHKQVVFVPLEEQSECQTCKL